MGSIADSVSNATTASKVSELFANDKIGIYPAKEYLTLDGVTDDYTALYNLINTTINGAYAEIWLKRGSVLIGNNITIPSNVVIKSLYGGMLKPASGVTITGTNAKLECGLWQCFDLSLGGTIGGAWDIECIYSEWFGAVGDGVTDDYTAFLGMINLWKTCSAHIKLMPLKNYVVNTPIALSSSKILIIYGHGATINRTNLVATNDTAIFYRSSLSNVLSSTTQTYDYNVETIFYNLNFKGTGYGIGYAHIIMGKADFYNCTFEGFEKGTMFKGTNMISYYSCTWKNNLKGASFDLIASGQYGATYTSEGLGWNDGVNFYKPNFKSNVTTCYLVYYEGGQNESVVNIEGGNATLYNATSNVGSVMFYATNASNFSISGLWAEIITTDGGTFFRCDNGAIFANRCMNFKNIHFNNNKNFESIFYTDCMRLKIDDCVFMKEPINYYIQSGGAVPDDSYYVQSATTSGNALLTGTQYIVTLSAAHNLFVSARNRIIVTIGALRYFGYVYNSTKIAIESYITPDFGGTAAKTIEGEYGVINAGDAILTTGQGITIQPYYYEQYVNLTKITDCYFHSFNEVKLFNGLNGNTRFEQNGTITYH